MEITPVIPTELAALRRKSANEWRDLLLLGLISVACIPFGCEILPCGVNSLEQPHFLATIPTLQLLLAIDCFPHIIEGFVVNQAMTAIFTAEAFYQFVLVLENSPLQIVSHPDVQHTRPASQHVHAIVVVFHDYRASAYFQSVIPTKPVDRVADQLARGGTCFPLRPEKRVPLLPPFTSYFFHSSIIFTKSLNR
jgi:hypothetical protein